MRRIAMLSIALLVLTTLLVPQRSESADKPEKTAMRELGRTQGTELLRAVSGRPNKGVKGYRKGHTSHPLSSLWPPSRQTGLSGERPHTAVSGVGDPRERQAFPEALRLGDRRRSRLV